MRVSSLLDAVHARIGRCSRGLMLDIPVVHGGRSTRRGSVHRLL
jgi:hypothetical protein